MNAARRYVPHRSPYVRTSGYVHGTSPLNPNLEYENSYRRTYSRKTNVKIMPKPQKIKILYKKVKEEIHPWYIFAGSALILLFGIFLFAILYFNAETNHAQRELSNLRNTLQSIEEKNTFYETEISKSIDLELVEKTAKMRLDMSEPAPHQKKYINVPKQSYTAQNKE